MQAKETRKREKSKRPPRGATRRTKCPRYPAELKLRAVKLHVEEGFDLKLVAQEVGACAESVRGWVRRYQKLGRAGLETPAGKSRKAVKPKLPPLVKEQIVAVKKQHPGFGVRRIAHWLRGVLFLPASPETVRQTLHRQGLMSKTRKKTRRNPPKPRFFERSTPNQMWQSDIFTFRLGGKNAYLIGFMDDYSRYVVGLGLYRSQTAEHVLEVYRTAVGEYGVPKEQLTDNGRQYVNWRGKTRFQLELQKDRVHHSLSRPHHPMTLGKIERFWKTIWEEFLVRAQFGSFEEAQDRVRYWVKYYNHKRPHQGLSGLCPADRFFQIQQELRKVIEQGMAENVLDLAMNREPKDPFYMVGRMGGQSVVMTVEKGHFQMRVDGDEPVNEVNYPSKEQSHDNGAGNEEDPQVVQREGEGGSGAGGVDGAKERGASVPGDRVPRECVGGVGETGALGDAGGLGFAAGREGRTAVGLGEAVGEPAEQTRGGEGGGCGAGTKVRRVNEEVVDERSETAQNVHRRAEVPGGPGDVDGEEERNGALPGSGDHVADAEPVAGNGNGRPGAGVEAAGGGKEIGSRAGTAGEATAGSKSVDGGIVPEDAGVQVGHTAAAVGNRRGRADPVEVGDEEKAGSAGRDGTAGERDHAGPERPVDGDGRGAGTGGKSEDVLPVGTPGALGAGTGAEEPGRRAAVAAGGLGEGEAEETGGGPGSAGAGARPGGSHPGDAQGD